MPGEVRVPVRLEVIQSSINTVKAAMDSLKPNSSGWRELQKILQSMQKEANNLQITMSKPFSTQSQFTQAEKGINKLENALDQARLTMSRIDFSDLKLDTNQQAVFDGFKRQLQDIQNEAKTFKASLKQSLQMSDAWEGIQKLDPNTATHSFDEIIKAVENKVKTLQKNMQDAQKAFDNFQPKLKSAKFAEQFASNKDNSFKAAMGEDFSKFFVNGDQLKFKSGQKNPFYQFIQENLQLDSSQIEAIKQAKTRDLEQIFKDLDLSKILSQAKGTISEGQNKQANLNNANVAYEEAQRTSIALGQSLDSLRAKEDELQQKTNQVNSGLQQFEANTANAARNSTSFSNGVTQANQGLEGMRNQLKQSNAELMKYQRTMSNINSLKMTVTNFMGFTQVLNIVKKGVREAIQHIHELDDVMNGISVVTNMSTGDLWDQIDAYSDMASKYGVSIKGAYEVSRIYYQQGLETADVMTLTNETLKLAKISGLDYATTTDYMTTALRGFKMEMSDAGRVVDVYSNLAAHTAVSSEELAVAMSKTASSMESVGATFEESSAMIATMVAVTRESATNIGSALKSIAARYGEMKSDPTALKDLEGEALSYNKVDAALQSVGISLKDSQGEFRNMTDVILELADVWDQLDSTQQRYIATQYAGNRQQSRFLALVSNKDLLKSNLEYAQNSEGTGDVQSEKTLDSITSKLEQAKVAYQEFYTSIGLEDIFKGALDGIKEYINYLNRLPKLFGDIPVAAIGMVANLINAFKLVGQGLLTGLGKVFDRIIPVEKISNDLSTGVRDGVGQGVQAASSILQQGMGEAAQGASNTIKNIIASNGQNPPTLTTTEQLQDQLKKSDGYNELMTQVKNINFNPTQNISSQIESQLSQILQTIIQTKPQIAEAFASAGDDAIAGFVNHLVSGIGQVQNASQQLGHGAVNTLGDSIEAHSPSEATGRLGDYFVEGFLNHIADQLNEGFSKGEQLGKTTLDGLSSTVEPEQFEKVRSKVITGLEKLNPDSDQFAYNDEVKAIKGFGKHKKREALRQEYRDRYNQEKEAAQNATYEQYANGQLTQGMFADVINRVGIGRQQLGDQTVVKQLMRSQYKGTDQFKEIEKIGVGMNFTSELQRMVDAQNWMSPVGADMLKTLNELPRRRDEMTAAIQARAEALYEGNKADFLLGGGRAIKDFSPKEIETLIEEKRKEGKFSKRDEQIERGAYELVQQRQIKEAEEEKQKSIEVAKAKEEGDKDAQAREAERIAREQRESRQNFMGIQSGFISTVMGDRTQPKSDVAGEVTARIEAIKAEAQNKPVEIPTKVSPPSEQSVQEANTDAQNKVNAEPPIEQPIKVQATNELQSQFNKLKANYNTSFTELQNANLGQATAQMAIQNSVGSDISKKKKRELNNNLKEARAVVAEKEAAQKDQASRLTDFAAAHPEFQSQVDAILGIKKGEEGKSAAPTSSNAEALKEEAAAAEQAKTAIEGKKEVESSADTSGTDAGTTALKEQTEAANADTEALKEKNIAQNDGSNIPPSGPSSGPPSGPPLGPTQTFDDVERGMIHNAQSYQYDMTGEWGIPQTQPQPAVSDAQYLQALQQLQSARRLENTFEGEYSDEDWNQIVSAKNEAIKLKINPDIDEAELQAKINELKAKIEGETPAKVPVKAEISEQGSQRVAQDAQRVAQNAQLKTMQSRLQAAGFGNDDPSKEQKKAIMQAIKERERADRDVVRGGGRISSKMHIFQGGVAKARAKANERAQEAQNNVMQATQNAGLGAMNIATVEELNQALDRQTKIRKELQALEAAQSNANVIQDKLTAVQTYNDALEQNKQGKMSQEQVDQARQTALDSGFTEEQLDTGHLSSTIEQLQDASNQASGAVQEHATNLQNEINAQREAANGSSELANAHRREAQEARQHRQKMGGLLRGLSSVISMATMFVDKESEEGQRLTGGLTALSGAVSLGGGIAQMFAGDVAGGLSSLVTSVPMLVSGLSGLLAPGKSAQERRAEELAATAERLEATEKASAQRAQESKTRSKSLQDQTDKIKDLQIERFTSKEAAAEYQNAVNTLAESFPELISGFDGMGNAIYNAAAAAEAMTKAQQAAAEDAYQAATDKLGTTQVRLEQNKNDMKVEQLTRNGSKRYGLYNNNFLVAGQLQNFDLDFKEQTSQTKSDKDQDWINIVTWSRRLDKTDGANRTYGSRLKEMAEKQDLIQFNDQNQMIGGQNLSSMIDLMTQMDSSKSVEKQAEILQEMNRLRFRLSEGETDFLNKYVYSLNGNNYAGDGIGIYSARNFEETMNYLNLMYKDVNGGISSYQQELYNSTLNFLEARQRPKGLSFLQNGSALEGALAKYYADEIFEGRIGKDYDRSKDAEEGHTWTDTVEGELYADMEAGVGASLTEFYGNLSKTQIELMELYLTESDKYSFTDLANIEGMSDKLQGDAAKVLENYYKGISENISINLNDMFSQITLPDNHDIKNLAFNKYTDTYLEQEVLGKFLQNYKTLTEAGLSTGAEDYLNAVTDLYRMIEEGIEDSAGNIQTFSAEVRVKMLGLINKYGIGNEEEISRILSAIDQDEDLAPFRDSLVAVLNETHSNVSLALQASISNIQENWKSTMDGLAKAINGVGMDEKQSLIDNAGALGVELSDADFRTEGSNFILDEDKYLELVRETQASYNATSESYKNRLDKVNEALKNNLEDVDKVEIFNTVGLKYSDYKDDDVAAMEALQEAYTTTYTNYLTYKNMVAQIENEATLSLLKAGKFNAILQEYELSGFDSDVQNAAKFERLIQLAMNQDYTDSELLDKNIKETVKGIQSSYNKLLSDILSKGLENIDWSDYDYITKDLTFEEFGLSDTSSTQDFVRAIGQATGSTRAQINDLLVQAIQKDNEKFSGAVFSNVSSLGNGLFTTDLNGIKELANTYDLDLTAILSEENSEFWDAVTGQVTMSFDQLETLIKAENPDFDLSQIHELRDTIQESFDSMMSSLTNAVKNGLSGTLDTKGIKEIRDFLKNRNINLDIDSYLTRGKEGYSMSIEGARELYNVLVQIDSISAQILLDTLSESDAFASASVNAAKIAKTQREMYAGNYQTRAGNVNLLSHAQHKISAEEMQKAGWSDFDGDYATLYSSTITSQDLGVDTDFVLNVTPITNDGKEILGEEDLNNYVASLLEGSTSIEEIYSKDKKGLVMGAWQGIDENLEKAVNEAEHLQEESAAIVANMDAMDETDDGRINQYKEELSLVKEIQAIRATSEDSSFNFMSNKIPSAQNNPINYFSNWQKAFQTINDAKSNKNQIDYTDFYNIITEMGNLAEMTGEIPLGAGQVLHNSEEASALIEQAANYLTVAADGTMKVDLSQFGVDFFTGASDMNSSINAGIKEMAASQVEMLDGMIQLMETIVAMEQLGDIDVGENGIIDFGDLFEWNIDWRTGAKTTVKKYSEGYDNFRNYIIEHTDKDNKPEQFNEDLAKSLNAKIKVGKNEFIFGDILNMDYTELAKHAEDGLGEAYAAMLQAYKLAAESGNYNLDNIFATIKEILAGTGFNGEIDLGNMHLVFVAGDVLTAVEEKDGKIHYHDEEGNDLGTDVKTARQAVLTKSIEKDIKKSGTDKIALDGDKVTIALQDNTSIVLTMNKDGLLEDTNGKTYNNIDDYISTVYKDEINERWKNGLAEGWGAEAWKIDQGITIVPTLNDEIPQESISKFKEDGLNSFEAIKNVWSGLASEDERLAFKAKYHIDLTGIEKFEDTKKIEEFNKSLADKNVSVNVTDDGTIAAIQKAIDLLTGKTVYIDVKTKNNNLGAMANDPRYTAPANNQATGSIGLAKSQGTLMGELGPELVVQGGHYFVAGQDGAEFVDLDPDAIVFNHLQTESLFKNGMSKTRGKAVTNERVATSFAKGNVNGGPAQASASQALAALKQLRNQWKAIAELDPSQMAGAGGGGGGGGDPKAFLKDLEKWYNWLQQIAQLEKEITYEETKRSKIQSDMIAHGQDYHKSQMETLKALQQQLVVHQSLTDSQYEYFEKRRKELNEQSAFSALYGFGESGQLYYKEGALSWLSDLSGRNVTTGEANYTAEEQYKRLVDAGFEFAMKYDSSGNEIKQEGTDWYSTALQAFWDKMDADKEEMQSLHDSVEEHRNAVLESQASINEIIRDIEDNQINVEQKVLKAIEDSRQREIDEFQKERDAIEKSSKALIDGLSEQLNLEKEMYSNQQEADEFGKLQRQLAILQRSGGSASQITDLQRQISEKQQNMYFDAQQQQIDALQKASDNQLERLDHQIELMTEQLEYEKENGLLWNQVYEVLQGSPESISEFIKANTIEYWGQSPTELTKTIREDLFEIQRFKEFQETMDGGLDILTTLYGDEVAKKKAEKERKEAEEKAKTEGNFAASTAGGNGGGNSSGGNGKKRYQQEATLFYIDSDYGNKISKAVGISEVSVEDAQQRALANAKKAAKNYRDTVKITYKQYERGGMVESTGPALLHAKESVLTASQTATLRNDILSNKPTSLLSLLTDFRDAYNNISNATNSVIGPSDGGIIIENATVEMNVSQIANDYDAQRAGEQALDRMIQIARKSQGWNRIGG